LTRREFPDTIISGEFRSRGSWHRRLHAVLNASPGNPVAAALG
jgi:hypothetical protein